jgi:hypothetical protein
MKQLSEEQLYALKDKIDNAKNAVSKLNGQKEILMKQLFDIHGCETIEEAEKKLKEMDAGIIALDRKINKGIEDLTKIIEVEGEV